MGVSDAIRNSFIILKKMNFRCKLVLNIINIIIESWCLMGQDDNDIYKCIPESDRKLYGDTVEEQCKNFLEKYPQFQMKSMDKSLDLSTDDKIMDYIVQTITNELGAKNLAYKGGYILNKRIPNIRKTFDVDFSIANRELYEDVKHVLHDLGDFFVSQKVIESYRVKDYVNETKSGGIKFKREGYELGVDVGLHPLAIGITSLTLEFGEVFAFSIERSIADKIAVLCSRKRFRRVKDLYDIYMMIRHFNVEGKLLCECLELRQVEWNEYPDDEETLTQLAFAYHKLNIYRGDSMISMMKPEFEEVMILFSIFCKPLCDGVAQNQLWDCEVKGWK